VRALAASPAGIKFMQVYLNGVRRFQVERSVLDGNLPLDLGAFRMTVLAKDANGVSVQKTINFTVDAVNQPYPCSAPASSVPAVNICAPADGSAIASPVRVLARALSEGHTTTVTQLYLDGQKVAEYTGDRLDLRLTMSAGTHRVTVQSKDDVGNIFKKVVNIIVQ
jgi:hypothetical protein